MSKGVIVLIPVLDGGSTQQAGDVILSDGSFELRSGGTNVLLGDGSVRFLRETLGFIVLRSLVTLNGGEVISADSY